jgi:hypothetical protein
MGDRVPPVLDAGDYVAPPAPDAPQVFVRTFAVPPGMPWTQARAADLEVRHGAPLPLGDLMHRLKRREGWRPGQAGRFAAFYIRRSDFRAPFETTVDVDGETRRVAFGSKAQDLQRLRAVALGGAAAAVVLGLVVFGLTSALAARGDATGRLDSLAGRAEAQLRQADRIKAQTDVTRALGRAQGRAGLATDVLDDLDWLARGKAADAQILAVHWDHGLMAVESRGETTPVVATDRQVVRAPHAQTRGLALWGIRPATSGPVAPR